MAGEVGGVGKGFFNESGELKSKSQISKEDAAQKSKAAPAQQAAVQDTSISTAVASVRSQFTQKANDIISVINQDEDNLKAAQKAVKQQLDAAKDLKAAIKDKDKEQIQIAQEKYEKAAKLRNDLADKIAKDNDRVVADRAKNLSVGNQQIGIVRTEAVKLEKVSADAPRKLSDVNDVIDGLKSDRAGIIEQRQELRSTKAQVADAIQNTDSQLSRIEERSVRSLQEAQDLADKLNAKIVGNGAQALSASKISEDIARQLLQ